MGLTEPGASVLIRAAYKLLKQQTYFTAGVKEVRAWTIDVVNCPAAGVIHTDFEKDLFVPKLLLTNFVQYVQKQNVKAKVQSRRKRVCR
jgi:ribosome-binding ATPase YchF (GTP1/OBG family)